MKNAFHWIKHQFKWQLSSSIAWAVILGILSLLIGWLYGSFGESSLMQLLDNLPDYMIKALMGDVTIDFMSGLESYLSLEYFSWMGLMFAFYPFLMGTAAISGEIETKTIEPLVSKPFSRHTFYWGKFFVIAAYTIVIILFNMICLWAGLKFVDATLPLSKWFQLSVLTGMATVSFVSISLFLSSVMGRSKTAMTSAIAIGILQYVFSLITKAVGKASWAKWTIFYHADVTEILKSSTYPWGSTAFLLVITVAFAITGWMAFVKRDI